MNRGVVVVVAGFIVHLNLVGYLYSYNLLHIQLKESFNSTATEAALPGSISIAFYAIWSLPTTWIFQHVGDRKAGILGIILCCVGLLLSSFVHNIWLLCLTYGIMFGMGCNAVHLVTVDMIVALFKESATRCLAIILTASSVGVLCSPALEWLYFTYEWRRALRILSVMFSLICMPCMLLFRNKEGDENFTPTTQTAEKYENLPKRLSLMEKYLDMMKRTEFLCMMCAYAMAGIATTFSFISIGSFLADSGMSGPEISLLLSLMGASDVVVRIIMSVLSGWLPISVTSQYAVAHVMSASFSLYLPFAFNRTAIWIILIGFLRYEIEIRHVGHEVGKFLEADKRGFWRYSVAKYGHFLCPPDIFTALYAFSIFFPHYAFSVARAMLFVLIASAPIEIAPVYSSVESVGLVYLILGIAALSTPYMTDNLFDVTGSYDSAFYLCSTLYAVASVFLFISVYLKKKSLRIIDKHQTTEYKYDKIESVKREQVSRVTVL